MFNKQFFNILYFDNFAININKYMLNYYYKQKARVMTININLL